MASGVHEHLIAQGAEAGRQGRKMARIHVVGTADTKGEELAYLSERIAAAGNRLVLLATPAGWDRKAPLPTLRDQTPTWAKASALARRWQLNQLADRLAAVAEPPSAVS